MLKRRLCEARFEWKLSCEGPLLIADGRYEKKRTEGEDRGKSPHKIFISRAPEEKVRQIAEQARTAEQVRLPFFVPGTSLRGPVRAQAERILRTLIEGSAPATACDPFQQGQGPAQSCSKRLDETHADVPYAAACPACRLFGCTGTASRIQFSDADIDKSARSVFRDMIGIDRFTGGVYQGEIGAAGKKSGGANMRFHALEGASFTTAVNLVNFELWQLGLLAFVFRDFEEGLVSIGFGKTKGFGQVKGTIGKIQLVYPNGRHKGKIQHLYSLAEQERNAYHLHPYEAPDFGLEKVGSGSLDLFETFEVRDVPGFWATVAPAFTDFVEKRQSGEAA
ncbi:MAG TPA: RAMP superfamily CRISPR-associated protein [Thermoanaerobaculia bacterium]|jgi:CRISPR/Cas system CSM-associated protein Csm3 (group 7 of RAMP superfamily)